MVLHEPESVGLSGPRLDRITSVLRERYVDAGLLAGILTLVARHGRLVHVGASGLRDVERGEPVTSDTVWRLYSMTKPVTSVALMTLYERGRFQLDDPVDRWLPELGNLRVWTPEGIVAAASPVTVQQLLTHTSGFTYGFMMETEVDALYREAGIGNLDPAVDLATTVERLGELPLLFHPGTRWNYSVSTDVVGRLIEVLADQPLDDFLDQEVLAPLGLRDTAFHAGADQAGRLAACYVPSRSGLRLQDDPRTSRYLAPPAMLSGGGGLVGTAPDYLRFASMLLNGGELDGVRILGRKTVAFMRANHLPSGGDLTSMGRPRFSETSYDGIGFGLGFSVTLDPARAQTLGSAGNFGWGGAATTFFWIDPSEDLIGLLFTQLIPSSTYPIRRELQTLVYQALID